MKMPVWFFAFASSLLCILALACFAYLMPPIKPAIWAPSHVEKVRRWADPDKAVTCYIIEIDTPHTASVSCLPESAVKPREKGAGI